jgi:hypothetical protein
MTEQVDKFLKRMEVWQAAESAGLPRFECACGQEIWALEDADILCRKCGGAFRLKQKI